MKRSTDCKDPGEKKEEIGNYLQKLRKENNLTQEQVAEKLYVSSRSISRWENARTMPDLDYLMDLAKLYGVTIDQIL
ncbi:MAG: helix-turn-helix transcriptional regulator [Clostridiaceae bacterium]|nr:helix-turn-helix transcriptional regulator [Clostridiaceae bacterium]